MLVGFDASRAFVSEATGTENYSLNLLRALAKIDSKNEYRIYFRSGPVTTFPPAPSMNSGQAVPSVYPSSRATRTRGWPANFEFVKIRPHRFWTQVGLALETWRNPVDVLFVPAHTLPILRRRSIGNFKSQTLNSKQYLNTNIQRPKRFENLNLFRISDLVLRISSFFAKKTKYVVTIHDLGVEFLPGYHSFPGRYYLNLASKYAAREADALIAVSRATRTDLIKRYSVDVKKVFVVPEGVDIGFFKPQPQPKAGSLLAKKSKVESVKSKYKIQGNYVLAVGTVQPRKNLETLIRAFAEVIRRSGIQAVRKTVKPDSPKARQPDSQHLVIVGKLGWDYQKIIDLPKKLGIGDRVKFLGYVDSRDMPALYTGASVFAACSLFEGFDLPILEALACGCGVVASDIGAHREILASFAGSVSRIRGSTPNAYFSPLGVEPLQGKEGFFKKNLKLNAATRKSGNSLLAEAMVLVKPNDTPRWTQVLYQYISLYNNRLTLASKKGRIKAVRSVLSSQYSWEKTSRESLKVFCEIGLE